MKNTLKVFVAMRSIAIIVLVAVIGFSMTACGDISVPVSGVTLNKSSISLAVGGTETLTATVSPSDATNKDVGWSSNNSSVATVTYGTVTAVSAGSATITVTTADGGKTAQCTVTVTSSSIPTNYSLDGVWEWVDVGRVITISGSTGVFSGFENNLGLVYQDAIKKGYWSIGGVHIRNLTSTGNLTWSGEYSGITRNNSSPNVATGIGWISCIYTLSADGQTLTCSDVSGSGSSTWRRSNYKLDGVWEWIDVGRVITISGSTGVFTSFEDNIGLVYKDAISKGYWSIGGVHIRNLTSTGNLTWSGEYSGITRNNSSPNVATGIGWISCIYTLSTNGQTLTCSDVSGSGSSTWTRKQ